MTEPTGGNRILGFFRTLFFSVLGFFALIGVTTSLLLGLLIYGIVKHADYVATPSVLEDSVTIENSMLTMTLDGPIVAQDADPAERFFSELMGEPRVTGLAQLLTTLRRASQDERVKALYLDIKQPLIDLTTVFELRRALDQFRASGKPVYASLQEGGMGSYLLAASAQQINLSPLGGMLIPGPVLQLTYFGPALQKLGLEMEVFRAGKYKSAMEPFTSAAPSEPTLEMYQDIESSLRSEMIQLLAKGRSKEVDEVSEWMKRSTFTSQQAKDMGLIDTMAYETQWRESAKESAAVEHTVEWRAYLKNSEEVDESITAKTDEKEPTELALIQARGDIRMQAAPTESGVIVPERLIPRLKWARETDSIKAVVLRIDSPGGSALASDLIWDEVRKLAEAKPLVVSMGAVAASGGYYIAAPATMIMADPVTITGSIGVIGAALNGKAFPDKYGVHFHVVTTSERRDYFDFGSASSEADRERLAEGIDEVYRTFVTKVAAGRKKDFEGIDRIAQGRVYTGSRALQLGLVDRLGGQAEAFRAAKELAGLDPDKLYPLAQYRGKPTSIFDCLNNQDDLFQCLQSLQTRIGTHFMRSAFGQVESQARTQAERLLKLSRDSDILTFWPGSLSMQQGAEPAVRGY